MSEDIDLWHRAQKAIAQNVLTNSKSPYSHVFNVSPKYIKSARDAVVKSADGKLYTDYICGLGTNILGYANHMVTVAIEGELPFMGSHSLPTRHEIDLAEKLKEVITFVDKFKFLKTGTEACMAAIKIARAHTGRDNIYSDGYHGWSDPFISLMEPASGVWKYQSVFKLPELSAIDDHVAAVIVEPVITDYSDQRRQYLQALRERCNKVGAMLIFDEVITGFRFKKWTVARYFNIIPDLIVIGKAMANGMPISAVGGKKEIMDNPEYFVSSTYAGDVLSLVASYATIHELQTNKFYSLDDLWNRGQYFLDTFNAIAPDLISIEGFPTRGIFKTKNDDIWALFQQETAKAGILVCRSWFYNAHHAAHDDITLIACREILDKIKRGKVNLEGMAPVAPLALMQRMKKE